MTAYIFPEDAYRAFEPENVVPAALFLVSKDAPTDAIVAAGGGVCQSAFITMNDGILLPQGDRTPEGFAAAWKHIADRHGDFVISNGMAQSQQVMKVLYAQRKRSEEHTSELQSLMRISYAVF